MNIIAHVPITMFVYIHTCMNRSLPLPLSIHIYIYIYITAYNHISCTLRLYDTVQPSRRVSSRPTRAPVSSSSRPTQRGTAGTFGTAWESAGKLLGVPETENKNNGRFRNDPDVPKGPRIDCYYYLYHYHY